MRWNGAKRMITLRENRKKHLESFSKAQAAYREKLIRSLEAKLYASKKNKKVSHHISLNNPEEYLAQYDQAIEVELNSTFYAQLVLDQWSWREEFD